MYTMLRQAVRPPPPGHSLRALWFWAVLAFALSALVAPLGSMGAGPPGPPPASLPDLERIQRAFERVITQAAPSVVGVRVQRRYLATLPAVSDEPAGGTFEQLVTVNGSGTIIGRNGLILTNEHVIQAAENIDVVFHDGGALPATLLAADPRGDLAVLHVARDDLTPVRMTDWSRVARGQWTIALGNPYGLGSDGQPSASVGVIANLDRRLPGLGEVDDRFYADMIQTTADVHPGCSGGGLFDINGELVGIITAMHTRAPADDGVGFAIPMTPARRRLINRLAQGKPAVYGYLGVTAGPPPAEQRPTENADRPPGALVKQVEPGGPAGQAGIRPGDLIVRFDSKPISGPGLLAELVGQTPPGTSVPIDLRRAGRRLVVRATLQRRQISRVSWMRSGAVLWRGMRLAELTPAVRRQMDIDAAASGVVVIDVGLHSPARRAGLRIGDVIEGVAERCRGQAQLTRAIHDLASFQSAVRGQQGPIQIRVRSRGQLLIPP